MSTSGQEGQGMVPGTGAGCSKERAAPGAQPQLEKSGCPRKLGEWKPAAEIPDFTVALFQSPAHVPYLAKAIWMQML